METGLTPFLLDMQKAPEAALRAGLANPQALAVKHGIPVEWVMFYVGQWLGRA